MEMLKALCHGASFTRSVAYLEDLSYLRFPCPTPSTPKLAGRHVCRLSCTSLTRIHENTMHNCKCRATSGFSKITKSSKDMDLKHERIRQIHHSSF